MVFRGRDLKRGNIYEIGQLLKCQDGKLWPGHHIPNGVLSWPSDFHWFRKGVSGAKENVSELFKKEKASMVFISQKRIMTTTQISTWITPLHSRFPNLKIYDLSVVQNYGHRLLHPFMYNSWKIPETETYSTYRFVGEQDELGLNIENTFMAYQFIVSQDLYVRWCSVGPIEDGEFSEVTKIIEEMYKIQEVSNDTKK